MWAQGQSFAETAMMFSRTQPMGSARVQALGGAQTALGGDFSAAFSNPAGLGMFNRSEFSFTPGLTTHANVGDYFAGENLISADQRDSRSSLNIASLGVVLATNQPERLPFIRGTFAIAYTKTNNFHRDLQYQGLNPATSIIDYFIEDATGGLPSQFSSGGALANTPTGLAYDNYLIGESTILDPNNNPTDYFTDVLGIPYQTETIRTSGMQSQWSFSYGANFNDKFFVGAGIGIHNLRYTSEKSYTESFDNEPVSRFTLNEFLDIRGSGISMNLGTIVRPIEWLQVGASLSTPTLYSLIDTYYANMNSRWKNFEYLPGEFLNNESASTDDFFSEYNLRTPTRMAAGVTAFAGKQGFVTAEIEQLNFARARYSSDVSGLTYSSDNDQIRSLYQRTTNLRLGAEYRLQEFRFRGGVAHLPDPFKTKQNDVSRSLQTFTAGVGYRTKSFFADATAGFTTGSNSYRPYRVSNPDGPLLTWRQQVTTVVFTFGFSF